LQQGSYQIIFFFQRLEKPEAYSAKEDRMASDRERPENVWEDDRYEKTKKRLFIGLVLGTGILVCLSLVLLWAIPCIGFGSIHPYAPWIFGALVLAAVLVVLWASLGLVLTILSGKDLPCFKRMRGITIRLFLPLMTLLGQFIGLSKDRVRSSFIKVNNQLVESQEQTYSPDQILLLMPHCLQRSDCTIRLTYGIHNCKRCGRCAISGLIALAEKYGLGLAIATGGTIARKIVVQKRPKLIIAVACERDLASGIQDIYPLPAYGVLNIRPHGPCMDTQVPMARLEEAIRKFLRPRYFPENKPVEAFPLKVQAVAERYR
jgi:hypothetical protein